MDREEKEAMQAASKLLTKVGLLMEQAEQGILDTSRPLPDDIMDRLEDLKYLVNRLKEEDEKLRESLEIDNALYRNMLAHPKALPKKKQQIYDRAQRLINKLRSRSHMMRAEIKASEEKERNPDMKLPEFKRESLMSAVSRANAVPMANTQKKEEQQPKETKHKRKERSLKQYRKVGGYRHWKKL